MKLRREFKQPSRVSFDRGIDRARRRSAPKKKLPRWVLPLVGVLGVFAAMCALLWIPQIRITSVSVSGARVESVDEIREIALRSLEGTYAFVVPRNSIFLYPGDEIQEALEERYPRIRNVDVGYRSATSVGITFEEREPFALWCEGEGACAFLDTLGYAFARAPHFSGSVFFEAEGTTTVPQVGVSILEDGVFQNMMSFKKDLETLLLGNYPELGVPRGVDLTSETSFTFRIQGDDPGSAWRLLVKREDGAVDVLKNLDLALAAIAADSTHKGRELLYVDARLGKKIFTKFKE